MIHLCIDDPTLRILKHMFPMYKRIEIAKVIPSYKAPEWAEKRTSSTIDVTECFPLEELEAMCNFKEPVLYSMTCNWRSRSKFDEPCHGFTMIQVPLSTGYSLYRVIQSYGKDYGLTAWIDGKTDSPFQGWMTYEIARHFLARCLCVGMANQTWLAKACHQLAFGTSQLTASNNIDTSSDKVNYVIFNATPFNWKGFHSRLTELQDIL